MPAQGPRRRRRTAPPAEPRARRAAVYEREYQVMLGRLRETRLERGLTQAQVAEQLGRPISFVSKCELGERRIDPIDLMHFARIYDVSVLDLLP